MKVACIGAGSWGTAVARLLALNGHETWLWAHSESTAGYINEHHKNPRYLVDCELPQNIIATSHLKDCLDAANALVFVVPSAHLRSVAQECSQFVRENIPAVVLTKGIENKTGKLMIDVVLDELPTCKEIACLSGPNHAEEVSRDLPSAAVVACKDPDRAVFFRDLFHAESFRVYVSDDPIGVEICAAAKNVIAIACGISRGFGTGDNTAALLMTRGLAEMSRLVNAYGGKAITCMGLAGMGDLIATCTSSHSRNATFGRAFAEGESLEHYCERTHMVVEGALACISIREAAKKLNVDVPIADAVWNLLYGGFSFDDVFESLVQRTPKDEFYGLA